MTSVLIRMSRNEALELGSLVVVGTTAGWNHGGEDIYELALAEPDTPIDYALLAAADKMAATLWDDWDVIGGPQISRAEWLRVRATTDRDAPLDRMTHPEPPST